jgi:hypothetical protein
MLKTFITITGYDVDKSTIHMTIPHPGIVDHWEKKKRSFKVLKRTVFLGGRKNYLFDLSM